MNTSIILRNASVLGVAQAVSMAAGFISTAWVARTLGPEAYGIIGFATAFVSYFALVVVFGTDHYGTREIAATPGDTSSLLSRILGTRLIMLGAVTTVYLVAVSAIDRPQDVTTVLLIQLIGILSAAATVDFIFQGYQRMGPIAVRQGGAAIASMIAVLALVRRPDDLFAAAAIPCSAMLLSALLLAAFAHNRVAPLGISFSRNSLRTVLKSCAPILLAGIFATVLLNVDIVMLGFMRPPEDVGIYAGMARLYSLSMLAGLIVTTAFAPALSAAASENAKMKATYFQYIRITVFLGAPLCGAIAAFPDWAVMLVFGEEFAGGAPILITLIIAALISYACMAPLTALVAWRDQTAQMIVFAVVAGSNVALNFLLIPLHGGIGAAIATLAAQTFMLGLLIYRVRTKFALFGMMPAAGSVVCSGAAFLMTTLAAKAISQPGSLFSEWIMPPAMAIAGTGLYILLTLVTGVIHRADLTGLAYMMRNRDAAQETTNRSDI